MHTALLERCVEAIGAVRKHISFSNMMRQKIGAMSLVCKAEAEKCFNVDEMLSYAPDATNWKVIDHCSAVTRIYALYESFVLQVLREYLVFLSGSYSFSDLGADFKAKYTRGIGQILLDQDKQRYQALDIDSVLNAAGDALAGRAGYQLQPEALIRAEQNLRMPELQRLFSHCGLSGIEGWINAHAAMKSFFADQSRLSETAASELKQIVEYRNEAAHGEVDDVLGADVLIEISHFFEAMCQSIVDFVQHDTLRRAKEIGRVQVVGVISEKFSRGIVVAKVSNAEISVNDPLYVYGDGVAMLVSVQSVRLNGDDVSKAIVAEEVEVGLAIGVSSKVGCELIRFI